MRHGAPTGDGEKRVLLHKSRGPLGFSIRGGCDFDLPVFISSATAALVLLAASICALCLWLWLLKIVSLHTCTHMHTHAHTCTHMHTHAHAPSLSPTLPFLQLLFSFSFSL